MFLLISRFIVPQPFLQPVISHRRGKAAIRAAGPECKNAGRAWGHAWGNGMNQTVSPCGETWKMRLLPQEFACRSSSRSVAPGQGAWATPCLREALANGTSERGCAGGTTPWSLISSHRAVKRQTQNSSSRSSCTRRMPSVGTPGCRTRTDRTPPISGSYPCRPSGNLNQFHLRLHHVSLCPRLCPEPPPP